MGDIMSRKDNDMKKWNPNGGFPTAEQLERMVAAEVKHLAEAALQREQAKTARSEARRDRLRKVYWRQVVPTEQKVDLETIFAVVGRVASDTFYAWRRVAATDLVALSSAGMRNDLDDLEFLVNRCIFSEIRTCHTEEYQQCYDDQEYYHLLLKDLCRHFFLFHAFPPS